tara:strand:+ start:211 stop:399 length:189 start_codon:yes stop_codon:yes gene_type:complete
MTKLDAMHLLGHRFITNMANDMGISAVTWHRMSDPLPENRVNEIIGLASRRGTKIPKEYIYE